MLRIKDTVSLSKELEKRGFKYKKETKNTCEEFEKCTEQGATIVFIWNREIFCQDLDVLYDLIQARISRESRGII